ncbi:MAG: M23 family metallopeptidase [Firmicutes bacterium]|nr:M23 family metallopeptidase [Bacillota bacterium]
MNKFSNENLDNIKAMVSEGTGVRFSQNRVGHIPVRSLLIAALIVVLATASVFAAYRISLSKKVIDVPEDGERGIFISMPFGEVQSPISECMTEHAGIDFPAPIGTPVLAAADGTVIEADFTMKYGNYVIIEHADGFSTVYAHMDEILCEKGQEIAKGDEIGTVGSTGRSTGPHLHFELRLDGEPQDPADYWEE